MIPSPHIYVLVDSMIVMVVVVSMFGHQPSPAQPSPACPASVSSLQCLRPAAPATTVRSQQPVAARSSFANIHTIYRYRYLDTWSPWPPSPPWT